MPRILFCAALAVLLLAGCATTHTGAEATAKTTPMTPGNPPPEAAPVTPPSRSINENFNLTPVAPIAAPDKVKEEIKDKGFIDWGAGFIRATGKAAIDMGNANRGQALLLAERAAMVDGQRKLLEISKGVRINGETVVEDMMLASDLVISQVDGIVKGARQMGNMKFDSTLGIVTVELVMNLYGTDGLSDAIRPDEKAEPETRPLNPEAQALLAKYSSIVIQGAGTNSNPSLFPRLYDEKGNLVLDTRELVGSNATIGQGAVQFVDNVNAVLNNAELGRNPLIIKVKEVAGKYLSDYVIPKEQADLLKTLQAAVPYLLKIGRFLLTLL